MFNIAELIAKYHMFAMFFIIMIEYACFPVSSEIVLPLSGAVASVHYVPYILTLLLSTAAGIIGSLICFYIGNFFGNAFLNKLSKKSKKLKTAIDSSYDFFAKYGNKAVLWARIIPLCRTYISFIAGASAQKTSSFVLYSSIGIFLWNSVLVGFGYIFGTNLDVSLQFYENYKIAIFVAIAITGLLVILTKYVKKSSTYN